MRSTSRNPIHRREAKSGTPRDGDAFRRLTLESGVWKWDAGRGSIVLVSPGGKKTIVGYCEFLDIPHHVLANLREHKGVWIYPRDVREFIEKNLSSLV